MELRSYQERALKEVWRIINRKQVAYLVGELRTGKTLVALHTANPFAKGDGYVLFVTVKKAIPAIKDMHKKSGLKYSVAVINYEQLHKVTKKPVFIIYDEAHCMGAYPKPSKRTKLARKMFAGIPTLFLSGTPAPESDSQLYHQFWVTGQGPWGRYKNFYQFAGAHIDISETWIGNGRKIKNYSKAKPTVVAAFEPYKIVMTQKEAGFDGKIIEKIHWLDLPKECSELIREIKKNRFSDRRKLTADTGSKLMSAIHQICSGTYIDDDRNRQWMNDFKVRYIKEKFRGRKIVIFYNFIAEGDMLKKAFKYWTDDPKYFDYYENVPFICQIKSGKEGIDLRTADDIIYFNINHSSVCYWQSRARSQSIDGGDKLCHWLFTKTGIEKDIYKVVLNKKNFTLQHFDERNYN